MTTTTEQPVGGAALFDAYSDQIDGGPVLGYLVLYSIFQGSVTPDELLATFREVGLDESQLPPPLRQDDAFERVTGPAGVRVTYSLDDPSTERKARTRKQRDEDAGKDRVATLMVRHVSRDTDQIVRHVVREVRDESRKALTYDTRLGAVAFERATNDAAEPGSGTLQVVPDSAAIGELPAAEQDRVREMLDDITETHRWHCTYVGGDRMRSVVRRYVENVLGGIKVRPTGGVYFVMAEHADTLGALREMVARIGSGSHFVRVPLPDQEEMREMVVNAFTNQAREDLEKLAADIAAAKAKGAGEKVIQALYDRYTALKQNAGQYSERLSDSLDDTQSSLQLVNLQLAQLMAEVD